MAHPVLRTGGEPSRIADTLLDALVGMLRFSFAFIRLNEAYGGNSIETARIAESLQDSTCAREIVEALKVSLGHAPLNGLRARGPSEGRISVTSAHLGVRGELGVVVAGSQKARRASKARGDGARDL
jgi:hypothetical protein